MDVNAKIKSFINKAEVILEIYSKNLKELSDNGINDFSEDMPVEFNQWVNEIKIFNERTLKNHPLYQDVKKACFLVMAHMMISKNYPA